MGEKQKQKNYFFEMSAALRPVQHANTTNDHLTHNGEQ